MLLENNNFQQQLALYREKKNREQCLSYGQIIINVLYNTYLFFRHIFLYNILKLNNNNNTAKNSGCDGSTNNVNCQKEVPYQIPLNDETLWFKSYSTCDRSIFAIKLLLWLVLWKVFILMEFGAVFFIFSIFLFMWYNLRNEPKTPGEISAYSVFNKDFKTLQGTFTAEQFEKELLHKS